MKVVVRTLLIWLLTLAVPLQLAAAATIAPCGPGDHARLGASVAQSPGAVFDDAVGHSPHHHHPSAVTSAESAVHQGALTDSAKTSPHKCSACASCCSAGALPSVVSTVPAPEAPPTVFASLAPIVEAFAADGPERPPRLLLA
jgi:hypothetical protein